VVLCVDEKTQIQALDRTLPLLPMGLGYVEGGHPRLHLPRHHHTVCRLGRGHRFGDRRVQTHVPAPGVSEFPTENRQGGPAQARRAPDRRQLPHSQARQSPLLAGAAATIPRPLHADLRLLAQPG